MKAKRIAKITANIAELKKQASILSDELKKMWAALTISQAIIARETAKIVMPNSELSAVISKPEVKGHGHADLMTTKRKVRKDFNPAKEYTVDVSECTEEEKKEVQQAFFDVGIFWEFKGETYQYLDEVSYTNTMSSGPITKYCKYGFATEDCNMTAKEFLDLVYEPEKQGGDL